MGEGVANSPTLTTKAPLSTPCSTLRTNTRHLSATRYLAVGSRSTLSLNPKSSPNLLKEMVCRQVQLSQDQTLSSVLRLQPVTAYFQYCTSGWWEL